MLQVTEQKLAVMGLTIDPLDPNRVIRLDQTLARRPDESWTTTQLQDYAVAGVRRSKALLDQARRLRKELHSMVRQTAYERWWVGCALHVLKDRLKTKREWTGWQRQQSISRTTVWRAIQLYLSFDDPEILRKMPIVKVYRALNLCPTKRTTGNAGESIDEEEGGPIMVKHCGRTIVANTPKEAARAVEAITHLPENCNGKTIDVITAERRAKRNVRRKKIEGQVIAPASDDDIRIYHCRFQELAKVAGIEAETVPFMFADVPYDGEFLPQISDLAQLASSLLVSGGALAVQTGTYYFDETTMRLRKYLTPVTFGITVWEGDANLLHPIQCASQCKPVWIYSKDVWRPSHRWGDVSRVGRKEKDLHDMQQPLEDAEHWLLALTNPGDLVVECCGGSFSMAIACYRHHRRYIGCDCDEDAVITGQRRLDKYRNAETLSGDASPANDQTET